MTAVIVPAYTPGEWLAVVTHGCVAFLPPDTTAATLHRVWESLRGADDAALVDHLQALAVGGLTALPPFALLQLADGRLHAVVRGPVEVHVLAADGARLLTAPHVATWSEEVVEAAEEVTVRPSGGDDRAGDGELPVLSGVVRASAVRIALSVPQAGAAGSGVPEDTRSTAAVRASVGPGPRVSSVAGVAARTARPTTTAPTTAGAPTGEPLDDTLLRPATPGPVETGDALADALADHEGATVLGGDLAAPGDRLPEWSGPAAFAPLVVAAPTTPARARIALSTGERVSLVRPVLLGRAPQASRVTSAQVPQLVTLPSPMQDISRTHAEVRMDGDDVVVTDLCSTNGVIVVRPAAAPQRLQPGEATVLEPGVLVDLGDGVTFTVERGA